MSLAFLVSKPTDSADMIYVHLDTSEKLTDVRNVAGASVTQVFYAGTCKLTAMFGKMLFGIQCILVISSTLQTTKAS